MKKLIAALIAPSIIMLAASSSFARHGNFINSYALSVTGAQGTSQQSDTKAQALIKFLAAQKSEQAGDYPGAVTAYKEAITLDPESVELRVALGSLLLKNKNIIDAESQAREALKLAPASIEVHRLIARVYLAQTYIGRSIDKEKARAAIKELEEVRKSSPNSKINVGGDEFPILQVIGELYVSLDENDKALEAFKSLSEGSSSSDSIYIRLAQLYYDKSKYRLAETYARKAYDINSKQPVNASLLAQSLLRIGRSQEALAIYKKTLGIPDSKDPKTLQPGQLNEQLLTSNMLFEYGEALVFSGQYDEALKLFEPISKNVTKDNPSYIHAVQIIADALRRSGRRDEAIKKLEEALKGQDVTDSLTLLYSLAGTYQELQQFDKAIETYEEALRSIVNPDGTVGNRESDKRNTGLILMQIADAYRMGGHRDKTMETFERMKKLLGPDNPRADELIVDALLDEGKYKEALESAKAASFRFPDEKSFKLYAAQASGKLGNLDAAELTLRSLLKGSSEDADVLSFLASIYLDANQLKQAEDNARKAVNVDPSDIGTLITLSIVQERQKKYKESEATLRKALDIDPDNSTLLNNLGYFLTERGERLPEAEKMIHRAVDISPTNGSFLDSLGWVYFKEGKIPEAQKYLEMAIIYSPRSGAIYHHLGDLYKKLGNTDKARTEWQKGLDLTTEPEEKAKIQEKLGKKK